MINGGVIKNLTIENSSMNIVASNYVYGFGFFVGYASTKSALEADTLRNITISDCHSINNRITITGTSELINVGFIAGYLQINQEIIPYILVSDCSTKYSNFTSSATLTNLGGNFGSAGLFFFLFFFNFFYSIFSLEQNHFLHPL